MHVSDGPNPIVQRRRLRAELRSAREAKLLTQQQVAMAMDWSLSKVIRVEKGTVGISTNDVKALLRLYEINDKIRVDELVTFAREARERSWWSQYRDIASPRLIQFIEYEAAASTMKGYQPLLVPGLLQTEEYARLVIGRFIDKPTPERVDALVDVRMKRQELLDRSDPPMLWYVVDEGVIRRLVGRTPVMQRQLKHLAEIVARPNVTLEIVPFSAEIHRAMRAPFELLELPDAADDDVLYLEGPTGEVTDRDSTDEIDAYTEDFEELRKLSLGPEESTNYLLKLAKEMS